MLGPFILALTIANSPCGQECAEAIAEEPERVHVVLEERGATNARPMRLVALDGATQPDCTDGNACWVSSNQRYRVVGSGMRPSNPISFEEDSHVRVARSNKGLFIAGIALTGAGAAFGGTALLLSQDGHTQQQNHGVAPVAGALGAAGCAFLVSGLILMLSNSSSTAELVDPRAPERSEHRSFVEREHIR